MMASQFTVVADNVVAQELRNEQFTVVAARSTIGGQYETVTRASRRTPRRRRALENAPAALGRDHRPSKAARDEHDNARIGLLPIGGDKGTRGKHAWDVKVGAVLALVAHAAAPPIGRHVARVVEEYSEGFGIGVEE